MSWTYTDKPATNMKDQVRFLCGDTDENAPLLTDGEIDFLLLSKGSPQSAAAEACVSIMAKLAREVDYTIGPESVSASKRFEHYKELHSKLSKSVISGLAVPSWEGTVDVREDIFDIGMHDVRGVSYGLPDKE